jgi:hypothetical protein
VQVALELSREHEVIQGAPEPGVDLRGLHRDGHPRAGRLRGAFEHLGLLPATGRDAQGMMQLSGVRVPSPSTSAATQTMRCRACGERYRRRLPYCPVCKHDPDNFGGAPPPPNPLK